MANSEIQISWLLDLDLHCLQRQGISGFSRTRVNTTLNEFSHTLCEELDLDLKGKARCRDHAK